MSVGSSPPALCGETLMQNTAMDRTSGGGRITIGGMSVDAVFHRFVEEELLPAIDFGADIFWTKSRESHRRTHARESQAAGYP